MTRRQWFLTITIVATALLAMDYLFLHVLFPMKKAALIEGFNHQVDEHLRDEAPSMPPESAAPPSSERAPVPTADAAANDFSTALRRCFGPQSADSSPKALAQRLRAADRAPKTDLENWHITRPDGRQERVMLAENEVRLFGVDNEGLPVPQELDRARAVKPTPEFIREVIGEGRVVMHQREENLRFADGSSARVEWINDDVRDMQVFLRDRTLSCRGFDCRCQSVSL